MNLPNVLDLYAAIDLKANIPAGLIDQFSCFAQFVQRRGQKTLPAKAGVDRHQQNHIDLIDDVLQHIERRRWIEYQTRFAALAGDQLQSAVDVLARFRMKGNVGGAC